MQEEGRSCAVFTLRPAGSRPVTQPVATTAVYKLTDTHWTSLKNVWKRIYLLDGSELYEFIWFVVFFLFCVRDLCFRYFAQFWNDLFLDFRWFIYVVLCSFCLLKLSFFFCSFGGKKKLLGCWECFNFFFFWIVQNYFVSGIVVLKKSIFRIFHCLALTVYNFFVLLLFGGKYVWETCLFTKKCRFLCRTVSRIYLFEN